MRENWFEKGLRSKVSKENHELDLDSVWNDIQANRSDKDRKKPFFWRWALIGFLLIGFSLAYMMNNDQETKLQGFNNSQVNETQTSGQQINDIATNKIPKTKNNSEESITIVTDDNDENILNTISNLTTTQSANAYSNVNSENSIKLKDNSFQNLNLGSNNDSGFATSNYNLKKEGLNRDGMNDLSMLSANLGSLQSSPVSLEDRSLKVLDINSINSLGLNLLDLTERKLKLLPSWEPAPALRKSTIQKKQMLSFGFVYGLNNDALTANIDSGAVAGIVDRRNMLESKLDFFSANLSYKRFLSSSLYLNVGLGMEQYTSRFEYEEYTFKSDTRVDTTEIIIYDSGEITFKSEEVPFVTTTINQNTNYLKYRSITLPVGLGLSTDLNDLFDIELEAGITYHLRLLNKGNVLNSVTGTQDLIPLDELYKSSSHFSSYAGFSINRYLNENWKIGLGIRANFDLTNRAMSSSELSHKMSSYSGQISISRIF